LLPLPVDPFIPDILDALRTSRAAVVTAQPGAGKTTRVPPALTADGPVILLQPRRVAARAIAQRIAEERVWTVGREIGWHVRFERRFTPATQLLVATEGMLTARLQQDPLLTGFRTIVLDEFHERSVHADLAIALARQAWRARDDLWIVVMSATLDTGPVSAFLDGCPVIAVPGRLYPLQISYVPEQTVAAAVVALLRETQGDVLAFLPGAFEIRRAISDLQDRLRDSESVAPQLRDVDVLPLHGGLDAAEQDRAVRKPTGARRRAIIATNIAETSMTVPDVTAVVDSGLHKVARYDAERAIDSLETERITQDSADQRAGRAGRIAPGRAIRLWDSRDRLRGEREPELHRIDLSGAVLDVIAWGGSPRELEWFDPPRADALDAALTLLARLDAVRDGALTDIGRQMVRLPLHPRLGRMLIAAGGARPIAQACALLAERHVIPPRSASTASDLLSAIDQWTAVPPHIQRVAREIEHLCGPPEGGHHMRMGDAHVRMADADFLRAVLAGYPDRVAQRREPGSASVKLASGAGAVVGNESGVREGGFLIAVDVQAPVRDQSESRIRIASRIEREWLQPNAVEVIHRFDVDAGVVRAAEVERYDALVLRERAVRPDPDVAAALLAEAWLAREKDVQLLRRVAFANQTVDVIGVVRTAAYGKRALDDIDLTKAISADLRRIIDRDAPAELKLPSGRLARLHYEDDGRVTAAVRLQEVFGLVETPRIGPRREPVVFALLAPNGRPVQVTSDLRSFWERTYAEVRKELRGRYPKHRWPEDPLGRA
jgi:ATP-dependent RNA helicase HrpB